MTVNVAYDADFLCFSVFFLVKVSKTAVTTRSQIPADFVNRFQKTLSDTERTDRGLPIFIRDTL